MLLQNISFFFFFVVAVIDAMVAYEGVPLHIPLFAKMWNEIMETSQVITLVMFKCSGTTYLSVF